MSYIPRNIAPPTNTTDSFDFIKPEKGKLSYDIPVYTIKGGSQPIIRFEMVFNAGSVNQQKPLQAFAVANLLKSGTAATSSEQINKLFDYYGVSLQIEAQKDLISVGFFCLTRHLEPVLDIFFEIIIKPVFPASELDILLKNKKQKHVINRKKIQHLARVHFNEILFGPEHPYGRKLELDDFEHIYRDDLMEFHHRFFIPTNVNCFVSGLFPVNITELLNQRIEKFGWKNQGSAPKLSLDKPRVIKGVHTIAKDDTLQSAIRIGKLMVNRSHADYHVIMIANALLGGFFGSRLMTNIRQEKGYTYGVNSAIVSLLQSSYFFIGTQVGKDVKSLAIKEIYNELKNLRTKPADNNELLTLRNYLSASFLRSFDGPFMQMERFKEILFFNLDYSHFENFMPTLKNLNSNDIQTIAESYFHEDSMIELTVG